MSTTGSDVAHILDALTSADATRAARAAEVVGSFGRALGHLIATLKAAPPSAPHRPAFPIPGAVAPTAWRSAYLSHWARVERIWLGGGLTAALGDVFIDPARAEVERLGVHGCPIDLAAHADVLALIGAARSRRAPPPVAVVLDFGGSAVKRAVALAPDGVAGASRDVVGPPRARAGEPTSPVSSSKRLRTRLMKPGAHTPTSIHMSRRALPAMSPRDDPFPRTGHTDRSDSLMRATSRKHCSSRPGHPVRLEFLHDGTAAARGLVDPGQAGLIVLGSFLAAGFPPPDGRLAPVANDFWIRRASR